MQFYGISLMNPYMESSRWQDVLDTNSFYSSSSIGSVTLMGFGLLNYR